MTLSRGVFGEITLIFARLGALQTSTAHPSPLMEAERQPQTASAWSLTEPNQNESVVSSPALHNIGEFRPSFYGLHLSTSMLESRFSVFLCCWVNNMTHLSKIWWLDWHVHIFQLDSRFFILFFRDNKQKHIVHQIFFALQTHRQ